MYSIQPQKLNILSLLAILSLNDLDLALRTWQSLRKLWHGCVNHRIGIRLKGILMCGVFK
jgi:hypothetical protein